MTVKEYAQYLLDNFPPDAIIMHWDNEGNNYYKPYAEIHKFEDNTSAYGFPEGVEQIVVI